MIDPEQWPRDTLALLANRINDTVTGQDYINWAVQALVDTWDSRSLTILAGLDLDGSVSRFEAEEYFAKSLHELGIQLPDEATILHRYVVHIARQIRTGEITPERGANQIHRQVVTPLGHPAELMAWCYVWEGLHPDKFVPVSESERDGIILQLATLWASRYQDEAT